MSTIEELDREVAELESERDKLTEAINRLKVQRQKIVSRDNVKRLGIYKKQVLKPEIGMAWGTFLAKLRAEIANANLVMPYVEWNGDIYTLVDVLNSDRSNPVAYWGDLEE